MANFDTFHWDISSSINFLFLKSCLLFENLIFKLLKKGSKLTFLVKISKNPLNFDLTSTITTKCLKAKSHCQRKNYSRNHFIQCKKKKSLVVVWKSQMAVQPSQPVVVVVVVVAHNILIYCHHSQKRSQKITENSCPNCYLVSE